MKEAVNEFILQELRGRNCRSVYYLGSGNPDFLRALVDAKFVKTSYSVSPGFDHEMIREAVWMADIRFVEQAIQSQTPGS
jgi:nucleotidyltransferase/DNA polymerase involved in DNA repair